MPAKLSPVASKDDVRARGDRRRALLVFALLIFIWGVNWPFMKMLLTMFPPLWFADIRMALGAITIFIILAAKGRIPLPPRQDLPVMATITVLQMAGFIGLISLGLHIVPAGRSAILSYTMPLWVTPAAALLLSERLTMVRALGLALGMGGVVVMFNPLDFNWHSRDALMGNACLLAAAISWAITILHVRAHRWKSTPLILAPWQLAVAFLILLGPAYWVEGPFVWPQPSWALLGIAFYVGPVITAFPFWASVTVARDLPAMTSSFGLLLTPVLGVLSAVVVLHERITWTTTAGLVLILAGVAAVSFFRPGAKAATAAARPSAAAAPASTPSRD